jgi:hypothetical protein
MVCLMDLLTTYVQHSELQALTGLPPVSPSQKSSKHLLSLFQPAVSSPVIPWQRLLREKVKNYPHFCFSNLFTQKVGVEKVCHFST